MSKINKETVLNAIYRLKETSNNKIWGLISLFIAIENKEEIKGNFTYSTKSDVLSEILQDLFYFGTNNKSFNSTNQLFFRLSKNWQIGILDYVPNNKPKIIDAAIFYYKTKDFNQSIDNNTIVQDFINDLNIPKSVLQNIFDLSFTDDEIALSAGYPKEQILKDFKANYSLNNQNDTLSFDSPFTVTSHPSEFKRAPFIQTLYSGSKIQELILLTDFDLDEFYPKNDTSTAQIKLESTNKIFYGAPGTGKSHKVNKIIKGKEGRTERVTFHPEYDYASFVGGYKPTMGKDEDGKETIRYEFVPQAFTNIYVKAWNDLENDYFLVIEEINRGNCAEIFGDIFQLLDRSNDYKITPSKELKEYLGTKLSGNENIDESKLLLPPNLNIIATMNTSDQSLFPMDSAFKRRWDWEYIPINYSENTEENTSAKFVVELIEGEFFNWLDFIKNVNKLIKSNDNLGMDKCLGNYFIKPDIDENTISLKSFINKVIFYLWNDVFKDEMEDESIFKNKTSYEDFFPIDEKGVEKVKEILKILKPDNESSEE